MSLPVAFHDLPENAYPVKLEALHPQTREVLWTTTIQAPLRGQKVPIYIPPLAKMFGHPVAMRVTFANGTVIDDGRPN